MARVLSEGESKTFMEALDMQKHEIEEVSPIAWCDVLLFLCLRLASDQRIGSIEYFILATFLDVRICSPNILLSMTSLYYALWYAGDIMKHCKNKLSRQHQDFQRQPADIHCTDLQRRALLYDVCILKYVDE